MSFLAFTVYTDQTARQLRRENHLHAPLLQLSFVFNMPPFVGVVLPLILLDACCHLRLALLTAVGSGVAPEFCYWAAFMVALLPVVLGIDSLTWKIISKQNEKPQSPR